MEFRPCLPDFVRQALATILENALGADVRHDCSEGKGSFGVWTLPAGTSEVSAARDRGLARLDVLQSDETFAFFLNAAYGRRVFYDAWERLPKRLNGSGRPDPGGPIHLTGASIRFQSPDEIVFRFEGYDERPWPDVDFTLTLTETFSVSGGQLQSDVHQDLDTDSSWLAILAAIFTVLFLPLGFLFAAEAIWVSSAGAWEGQMGVGLANLVPQEIMIPRGRKIVANYQRVVLSSGGIFLGGTFSLADRVPAVTIQGPAEVTQAVAGGIARRTYKVLPRDLRSPLAIEWTSEPDVEISSPNQGSTRVTFSVAARPGQTVSRRLAVSVADADDLEASGDLTVRVAVQPHGGEPP